MTIAIKASGAALATAAALLFSTAAVSTANAEDAKIQCQGVNGCKGQSACKAADHGCKGQNSCKGMGFLELSKKDCDAAKAQMKSK